MKESKSYAQPFVRNVYHGKIIMILEKPWYESRNKAIDEEIMSVCEQTITMMHFLSPDKIVIAERQMEDQIAKIEKARSYFNRVDETWPYTIKVDSFTKAVEASEWCKERWGE